LCIFGSLVGVGWAQPARPARVDPLVALRDELRTPVVDPSKKEELEARRKALEEKIAALRTIGDLQRALMLTQWQDTGLDPAVAEIDRKVRSEVVKRLEDSIRYILENGTPANRWAAANVIGELSTTVRETSSRHSVARRLAPDLVRLIKEGSPALREAAVKAMSNITPDPEVGATSIGLAMQAESSTLRRAAATGLGNLIQRSLQIIGGKGGNSLGVQSTWPEVLQTAAAVVPQAARGLTDQDVEVRRLSTEAIGQAAFALFDYLFEPIKSRRQPRELEIRSDLRPQIDSGPSDEKVGPALEALAKALLQQASPLARVLNDPSPIIRHQARRALENIADARRRLEDVNNPQPGGTTPRTDPSLLQVQKDLLQLLTFSLPNLKTGVRDSSEPVRLATVEVLELMGDSAAPAAPEMVVALNDRSIFVRWVAARCLGRMSKPLEVDTAVPALARLLDGNDLDLRMIGAATLERYGPAAEAAIPALVRTVGRGDAEGRIAAMRALETVVTKSDPAIPALGAALQNPNSRVRLAAAETLAQLGPLAVGAIDALREGLNDSNAEVRRAVSEALLNIAPSRKEK
jgi:HEAT repeat protein